MQTVEVGDLSALVAKSLEITNSDPTHEWWFRGQRRESFDLVPSLYRRIPDVPEALAMETRLLIEFANRSRGLTRGISVDSEWEMLFLMQHHRLPTRLLDWSRNLLIAAYFAVEARDGSDNEGDPPCVFLFDPFAWNTQVIGKKGTNNTQGPVTNLGDSGVVGGYEPSLTGTSKGSPLPQALAIAGPEFADRIAAQRGVFTVFGKEHKQDSAAPLDKQDEDLTGGTSLTRFRLLGDPSDWMVSLKLVGTGAFSAFPDLDGLSLELINTHF